MIEARQPTGKGQPNDSPAASSDSHPGARTAWHVHALSQTLHVTDGIGLAQAREGEAVAVYPGKTVYTPPASGTGTEPPNPTS